MTVKDELEESATDLKNKLEGFCEEFKKEFEEKIKKIEEALKKVTDEIGS